MTTMQVALLHSIPIADISLTAERLEQHHRRRQGTRLGDFNKYRSHLLGDVERHEKDRRGCFPCNTRFL